MMSILKSPAISHSTTQNGINMIVVKNLPQHSVKIQALLLHKIHLIACDQFDIPLFYCIFITLKYMQEVTVLQGNLEI